MEIECHSTAFFLEWKQGNKKKNAMVTCPKIHPEKEECKCTLEETIKYNKRFGYLPKNVKKFKLTK